jgi:rhodanese-related sulfurtransferase
MDDYIILIFGVILILLFLLNKNIKQNKKKTIAINVIDAKKLLKKNYYDYVIDVRTNKEWNEGRYPGAVHIPLKKLYNGVKLYDMNAKYLIYCETGRRARVGADIMIEMGFKNVNFLVGNYKLIILHTYS